MKLLPPAIFDSAVHQPKLLPAAIFTAAEKI